MSPAWFSVPSTFHTGIGQSSGFEGIWFLVTKFLSMKFNPLAPESMRAQVSTFRFRGTVDAVKSQFSFHCVGSCYMRFR